MTRKYLFADESGNFDFNRKQGATEYFAVGSVLIEGDMARSLITLALSSLRHELIWKGHKLYQGFHATTDKQDVRDAVFARIQTLPFDFDITILDKSKAQPHLSGDEVRFYQHAWFYHFKHIASRELSAGDELVVVAASLGTKKNRAAFATAVEDVIEQCCPYGVEHRIVSMRDDVDPCLQLADYCTWGIMRDVEGGDPRSRPLVEPKKRSEFELFRRGSKRYY